MMPVMASGGETEDTGAMPAAAADVGDAGDEDEDGIPAEVDDNECGTDRCIDDCR